MVERVHDMAQSASSLLRMRAAQHPSTPSFAAAAAAFSPDAALSRIHVFRAHDAPTQAAVCLHLPALVAARPRVRLIVLDSVAFHYRQNVEDYAGRARALAGTFASLLRLAGSHGIAVVVTNQVTTKPGAGGLGEGRLVPALGESFAHFATQRVLLYWAQRQRCAMLFKSPRKAQGQCAYAVTAEGVRSSRPGKRREAPAGEAY